MRGHLAEIKKYIQRKFTDRKIIQYSISVYVCSVLSISNILLNLYICMPCTICYSNILLSLCICMPRSICYINTLLNLCICVPFSKVSPGYVSHLCRRQAFYLK